MAGVLLKARVGLYSQLPPDDVRRAHLEPIADLDATPGRGDCARLAPMRRWRSCRRGR